MSDSSAPLFAKVINLSEISQTKGASVAYSDKDLGDIDPRTLLFLTADKSPTGKAAIMVGGALSSTVSLYELLRSDGQ